MYQYQTSSFGKWEKHSLFSPDGKNRLELVPDHGACVLDLAFEGISIMDAYTTPEELDANKWSKNVVLFPFPNRLKDGQYTWEGKEYQFPINDPGTGNALHGFGANKPMRISQVEMSPQGATLGCEYRYQGEHEAYPFAFTFNIQFSIDQRNEFKVIIAIHNDGNQAMPIGFGWHPYFQLGDKVEDFQIQFPPCELVGVDPSMIPSGKRYQYDAFEQMKKIGGTTLDNCFALSPREGKTWVHLKGPRGEIKYWQETGHDKYNFLQIFTPPYRSSIALEPMSCNVDAFNNGDGLIRLKAFEEVSAGFGLQFSP